MKPKDVRSKNPLKNPVKNPQKKPVAPVYKFDAYKWWKDRNSLLMAAFLLIVTLIVMFPSLKGEFLNWDDDVNIYQNEYVKNLNADNVKHIFTTTVIGNYNPLTNLSFALEYHFFGEKTFSYHLHNIILHLLNAFFVFWLMLLLRLRREWALFAALLFAVHPMRVESVAWITERKDVLFAFFYLAATISYIYNLKYKKKRYIVLTFLFFIPALLSKIQAVTLPLTLLLIDYLLGRPLRWRLIIEKIPYFLLSLSMGLLGIYFLGKQESLDKIDYSLLERILVGAYALCVYLAKSIYPYSLSAIYPFPKPGSFEVIFYIAPFILIGLAALVVFATRKSRVVLFGSLFFLVNIVFILQVVSAGQGFLSDRFSYIPYIGLAFIYAHGGSWLVANRKKLIPLVAILAVALVGYYAVFSFIRTGVWKNTDTLFTDVLKHDQKIATAYRNRGNYFRDHNMKDQALADFAALVRLTPNDAKPYTSRGKIYFDKGDFDKAFIDFDRSIKLDSTSAENYSNRGTIYGYRNRWDLSLKDFNKAIELNPRSKDALLNRGLLLYNMGRYDEAIKDLDNYMSIVPDNAGAFNLRGLCKASKLDLPGALKDYEIAISMNPKEGLFFQNRAIVYAMKGDKTNAANDFQKAEQLGVKVNPALKAKYMQQI